MSQGRTTENPICTNGGELPPPPSTGELEDPSEPHPDEPGAPGDAPARRRLPSAAVSQLPDGDKPESAKRSR